MQHPVNGDPMSDQPKATSGERSLDDKPFSAMTGGQKMSFIAKAFVFFVSGGFIFPTLWVD